MMGLRAGPRLVQHGQLLHVHVVHGGGQVGCTRWASATLGGRAAAAPSAALAARVALAAEPVGCCPATAGPVANRTLASARPGGSRLRRVWPAACAV